MMATSRRCSRQLFTSSLPSLSSNLGASIAHEEARDAQREHARHGFEPLTGLGRLWTIEREGPIAA